MPNTTMKIAPKTMVGVGAVGAVIMGAFIFSPRRGDGGGQGASEPSTIIPHKGLRRSMEMLDLYKTLSPRLYSRIMDAAACLEAHVAPNITHPTTSSVRAVESAVLNLRRHLASLEVCVRTQSHNDAAAVKEYTDVSENVLNIGESELHNTHLAYIP